MTTYFGPADIVEAYEYLQETAESLVISEVEYRDVQDKLYGEYGEVVRVGKTQEERERILRRLMEEDPAALGILAQLENNRVRVRGAEVQVKKVNAMIGYLRAVGHGDAVKLDMGKERE